MNESLPPILVYAYTWSKYRTNMGITIQADTYEFPAKFEISRKHLNHMFILQK